MMPPFGDLFSGALTLAEERQSEEDVPTLGDW